MNAISPTIGLHVGKCTVADVVNAPGFDALIEEYAAECAIAGLPAPRAKFAAYTAYEAAGALHGFRAVFDGELVGFISVLAPVLPHYSALVAVAESFFVAERHRGTGAGFRLLVKAERLGKELGSPGLLVSAPFAGKLFEVLPRLGYVETSRVFFKRFP